MSFLHSFTDLNQWATVISAICGWEGMKWLHRRAEQQRRTKNVDHPCA